MTMIKISICFLLMVTLTFSCKNSSAKGVDAPTKQTEEPKGIPPEWMGLFNKKEVAYLENDFSGIFTSDGKRENLFPIKTTGISTKAIKLAGEQFLNGLTKEQLSKTNFEIQDEEWRKWTNVANGVYNRQGTPIKEMTQAQRKLALELLTASLSVKGLKLTKDIMKTDQTLHEMTNNAENLDEELYYFTIMGKPSMTEPWGWQLEGHHLALNYFILGDQVVMTPTFMGGEPIITNTGKHKGNTLFQDEQNVGLKFMQSLNEEQQKKASLSVNKTGNDVQAEAFGDNAIVDYEGLPVSEMTEDQKAAFLNLTSLYINNMKEGHSSIKMEEIKGHLNETFFAWIGTTDEAAVFYYRIHSPVVLIEFDHQLPLMVKTNENKPWRNHIHTMVRTPNGNDYGKDLLQQHLKKHTH